MPFATVSGLRVHYELSGPPAAPTLVFSNSLGSNLSMWDRQMPAVEGSHRVLRYDARGHGQTALAAGACTMEDLGRDLLGLLDALGIERVRFCGLSVGGQIGQWLGAYAPERLQALVLCNTAAHIGTVESWDARIQAVLDGGTGILLPGLLERWFTSSFRERAPEAVARAAEMVRATTAEGYASLCTAIRDRDASAELERISTPTLVIAGSDDPATTPAEGRALAAAIAGARYVELKAAHLSNVEEAAEFNEALTGFLAGVEGGA